MNQETKKEIAEIIQKEIAVLAGATKVGFDSVNERFDKMDERFDKMDQRFDKMDQRFDTLEGNLETFKRETSQNFKDVRSDIAELKANLDPLGKPIEAEDLYGRVAYVEKKLKIRSGK